MLYSRSVSLRTWQHFHSALSRSQTEGFISRLVKTTFHRCHCIDFCLLHTFCTLWFVLEERNHLENLMHAQKTVLLAGWKWQCGYSGFICRVSVDLHAPHFSISPARYDSHWSWSWFGLDTLWSLEWLGLGWGGLDYTAGAGVLKVFRAEILYQIFCVGLVLCSFSGVFWGGGHVRFSSLISDRTTHCGSEGRLHTWDDNTDNWQIWAVRTSAAQL